jgi:hypothetical protein
MTPPPAAASAVEPRHSFAPGRPLTAAPRPRRVSGPARRPPHERPTGRSRARQAGIALGLIELVGRLSEHRLLDRLIRGRIWIGLVAFALIGIVTLQLGLLKLNAGIGHALQRESSLQRENATLSIENSELAAGNLVEASAVRLGMEMLPVGSLHFLTARPWTDAGKGAAALSATVGGSTATGESASATTATGSTSPSSGAEGSGAQSSSSQASTSSGESEHEAAKAPATESAKTPATESSSAPAGGEAAAEPSTAAGARAAPPTGSGSAEASGGTQAASGGK